MIIWKTQLKTWLFDYIFRVDNGLWEYEREYFKKFKNKTKFNKALRIDAGYNQLQGKFTALLCLAQDFDIAIPMTDRIKKRVKVRKGKVKPWK